MNETRRDTDEIISVGFLSFRNFITHAGGWVKVVHRVKVKSNSVESLEVRNINDYTKREVV